jgi:hypothetical protein
MASQGQGKGKGHGRVFRTKFHFPPFVLEIKQKKSKKSKKEL